MEKVEIFQYLSLARYKGLTAIFKKFNDLDISLILDLEDSAQDLFNKRVHIIPSWFDDHGLFRFDEGELLDTLMKKPNEPDTELIEKYFFP